MLGEVLPRRSEIWPQPMGHHVFLWRMNEAVDGGYVEIKGNLFKKSPIGAAIYSIISPEAEKQFCIDNNKYSKDRLLIARYSGLDFCDFESYVKMSNNDKNSEIF